MKTKHSTHSEQELRRKIESVLDTVGLKAAQGQGYNKDDIYAILHLIQSEREKVLETIERHFSIDEENGMDYYWISCSEWKILKAELAQKKE